MASLAGFASAAACGIFSVGVVGLIWASMAGAGTVVSIGAIGCKASTGACSCFVRETSGVAGVVAGTSFNVASCTTGGVAGGVSGVGVSTCTAGAGGGEGVVGRGAEGDGSAKGCCCGGNGHSQKGVGKGSTVGTPG